MRTLKTYDSVLIGTNTITGEFATADIAIDENGVVRISFDIYAPIDCSWEVIHKWYTENCTTEAIEEFQSPSEALDLLNQYDCKPSELADVMFEESSNEGFIDFYNWNDAENYYKDEVENVAFSLVACGQCGNDLKENGWSITATGAEVLKCWKRYHLRGCDNVEAFENLLRADKGNPYNVLAECAMYAGLLDAPIFD